MCLTELGDCLYIILRNFVRLTCGSGEQGLAWCVSRLAENTAREPKLQNKDVVCNKQCVGKTIVSAA